MNGRCANVLRNSKHGVEVFSEVGGMGTTTVLLRQGGGGVPGATPARPAWAWGLRSAQPWLRPPRRQKGGQRNVQRGLGEQYLLNLEPFALTSSQFCSSFETNTLYLAREVIRRK